MIINIHDLQLLCLEGNIRHQAEVVRSVGQGWKSALPNLLLTWHAESAESGEVSAVEDVVQHLLFLPALSDFPAGELQAAVVVGGLQLDLLVVGHSLVDRLAGLRIEVPGENDGQDGVPVLDSNPVQFSLIMRREKNFKIVIKLKTLNYQE